eukprot:6067272-Prymnesium_polylepis.1
MAARHRRLFALLFLLPAPAEPQACSPNCPYTEYKFHTCENRRGESNNPAEGYALAFGPQMMASPVTRTLDPSNSEIAKMSNGFTMVSWIRWNDATMNRFQPPITIGHWEDPSF